MVYNIVELMHQLGRDLQEPSVVPKSFRPVEQTEQETSAFCASQFAAGSSIPEAAALGSSQHACVDCSNTGSIGNLCTVINIDIFFQEEGPEKPIMCSACAFVLAGRRCLYDSDYALLLPSAVTAA